MHRCVPVFMFKEEEEKGTNDFVKLNEKKGRGVFLIKFNKCAAYNMKLFLLDVPFKG